MNVPRLPRRARRAVRGSVAAASVAVAALVVSPASWANVLTAGTLTQVPDHPFAGTSTVCDQLIAQQEGLGSTNYAGAEVEPFVSLLTFPWVV